QEFPWKEWKEPHLNFPDKMELYADDREEWRPVISKENFRDELRRGDKGTGRDGEEEKVFI
ncbi:MAG: hypothetical protein PHR77_02530, partial [Kiritimatiellae bacterium]|nr:hypothetical protein [Kiritimatiellia bacterium]MDD5523371.1 hypothetical protein [Kiritimatiellia bacterium]